MHEGTFFHEELVTLARRHFCTKGHLRTMTLLHEGSFLHEGSLFHDFILARDEPFFINSNLYLFQFLLT